MKHKRRANTFRGVFKHFSKHHPVLLRRIRGTVSSL
jgi:hypothetical protein